MNRNDERSRSAKTAMQFPPSPMLQSLRRQKLFFISPLIWLWDSLLDWWDNRFHKDRSAEHRITRHLRRAMDGFIGRPAKDVESVFRLQVYFILRRMVSSPTDYQYIMFELKQDGGRLNIIPANLFTFLLMFGYRVDYDDVVNKDLWATPMGIFSFVGGRPKLMLPKPAEFVSVDVKPDKN